MPSKSVAMTLFYFTESNLHVGSGSTLSDVDLPIQREIHTQQPIVAASGLKGALRELARNGNKTLPQPYLKIFGPEADGDDDKEYGGLGIFSEARVALFPVAALDGVYRWLTCPMVLARLRRDLRLRPLPVDSKVLVDEYLQMKIQEVDHWKAVTARDGDSLYLRDFELDVVKGESSEKIGNWFGTYTLRTENSYWADKMKKDVVVVSDRVFQHFVRYGTHIDTHVKIDPESGTVKHGPWLEESLPVDTLLWASIDLPESLEKEKTVDPLPEMRKLWAKGRFQLGGGKSLGMGWVSVREIGV